MQHAFLPAPAFDCQIRPDRERVVVRIAGELDIVEGPGVGTALDELFEVGFKQVVVDLRGLSFMDSTGLQTMLRAQQTARRHDGRLALIRGTQAVHRVFELTGTESLFSFEEARTPR